MTVLRNSLARCNARHLRIKRLVQFIFADPIYHNALTNCAALSCRALRRVARMCSRTVSGTAYRFRHGSTLCSPTVEKILCRSLFSKRSHIGNLRQIRKQGKGRSPKRKGNRRCPFLFVPAADAAVSRAPQSAAPSLRFSENSPPVKGEPPARFVHPVKRAPCKSKFPKENPHAIG